MIVIGKGQPGELVCPSIQSEKAVARLEHTVVAGSLAEHDTPEESLRIVGRLSGIGDSVVEAPDPLRSLDVCQVMIAVPP